MRMLYVIFLILYNILLAQENFMKKILFIFLSVFQINAAIVDALTIEAPIKPIAQYTQLEKVHYRTPQMEEFIEEIKIKHQKEVEDYEKKAKKHREEIEAFWRRAYKKAEEWWAEMPNWQDRFNIDNGKATICHDKNGIRIVSNLVRSFDQDDVDEKISQYQEPCPEIYLVQWQDKTFDQPLRLKWNSSRDDFVIELIRSGLYKGSVEEQAMYNRSHIWSGHHTIVNLFFESIDRWSGQKKTVRCRSIEHQPEGISLRDDKENGLGRVCASVELSYLNGRKIYLNHRQSYYEFMMRLIETGHVSFMEYPPYTIQGRSIIGERGREKCYYECYYYGDIPVTEDPLYKTKKLAQERQEQEKLRYEVELRKREIKKCQLLAEEITNASIEAALSIYEKKYESELLPDSLSASLMPINVIEKTVENENNLLGKFFVKRIREMVKLWGGIKNF